MHKPDFLLESDVRAQLDWDPLLDDSRIVVKADDGSIHLTGVVETLPEIERATGDAWAVGGVKSVQNELMVGLAGDAIADGEIAGRCVAALDAEKFVPQGAVTVTVTDGVVTLTGEVRRHYQRRAAESAVGHVAGVRAVRDRITLSDEPIPTDVAARIKKAFDRSAILDGSLIEVSSNGHTIYLDGKVGSYAALDAALDTAWAAPGVAEVVDRLVVAS
jgi:osmotically-inducible protein OsmY